MKRALSVTLLAVLIAFTGCSTVKIDDSATSQYPRNSIVIRNRIAYVLHISRNNAVLSMRDTQLPRRCQLPIEVAPNTEFVLRDATTLAAERIKLGIWAVRREKLPRFEIYRPLGGNTFKLDLGTNNLPIIITIKSKST